MSLRAIQKRDREKLSSTQRQQFISHQQQQLLRTPAGGGDGDGATPNDAVSLTTTTTTTTTTTAMQMTAARSSYPDSGGQRMMAVAASSGATVPSVQSIIQSQQAKRKQQQAGNAPPAATRPQTRTATLTLGRRRSSSYPTLCADGLPSTEQLRSIKSEADLWRGRSRRHRAGRGSCVEAERTGTGSGDCGGGGGDGFTASRSSSSFSTNNLLYLGAKSEVCLKTLAVKNMQQSVQLFGNGASVVPRPAVAVGPGSTGGSTASSHLTEPHQQQQQQPSKRLYESRRTSELSSSEFASANHKAASGLQHHPPKGNHGGGGGCGAVRIPIVGYEVMEERARFTIFKLRIENSISHTCWLVLRRYTDFVRLNNKLKTIFPHCMLVLPRKKWFGDNFSTGFIDNRIQGLQTFIDTILGDDLMRACSAVRDFFCLDEPPSYSESMEESRVIFEAQEETISQLKRQLQTKDDLVHTLQTKLATELNRNKILSDVIRNSAENCAKCSKSIDQQLKDSVYK